MKLSFSVNTRELFKGVILAIAVYYFPLPWWKWILYLGTMIGFTYNEDKK